MRRQKAFRSVRKPKLQSNTTLNIPPRDVLNNNYKTAFSPSCPANGMASRPTSESIATGTAFGRHGTEYFAVFYKLKALLTTPTALISLQTRLKVMMAQRPYVPTRIRRWWTSLERRRCEGTGIKEWASIEYPPKYQATSNSGIITSYPIPPKENNDS